jgi:hypothetical protein
MDHVAFAGNLQDRSISAQIEGQVGGLFVSRHITIRLITNLLSCSVLQANV